MNMREILDYDLSKLVWKSMRLIFTIPYKILNWVFKKSPKFVSDVRKRLNR